MLTTITTTLALVLAAAPALAQTEIPAEWVGIWELEIEVYDCDTDLLLFSSTSLDTLCEGDALDEPDSDGGSLDCTGSVDADSYTLTCSGQEVVEPGCTATYDYQATATRTGDSYTSVATMDVTFSGDCAVPDFCQRTEVTGTRISNDPGPCDQTPVESRTWGTVRSFYR